MFLLVPANPSCPGQNPQSCKMVVCVDAIPTNSRPSQYYLGSHNNFVDMLNTIITKQNHRYLL